MQVLVSSPLQVQVLVTSHTGPNLNHNTGPALGPKYVVGDAFHPGVAHNHNHTPPYSLGADAFHPGVDPLLQSNLTLTLSLYHPLSFQG